MLATTQVIVIIFQENSFCKIVLDNKHLDIVKLISKALSQQKNWYTIFYGLFWSCATLQHSVIAY